MAGPCSQTNILLVLQLLLLSTIASVKDFYGYVRFYDKRYVDESSVQYWYYTSDSQYCINLSCFDNKASPVEWDYLPRDSTFTRDLKAKIAFFTGPNFTGTQREWSTNDKFYPHDFSVDGIDNGVSSFIIYEFNRERKCNVLHYQWGNVLF